MGWEDRNWRPVPVSRPSWLNDEETENEQWKGGVNPYGEEKLGCRCGFLYDTERGGKRHHLESFGGGANNLKRGERQTE